MREAISRNLRFSILQRDGFKCCACGRNPKEDNIKLEVDHIISVVDGGKSEPSNLWTLCFDCNRGKAKYSILFAPPPLKKKVKLNPEIVSKGRLPKTTMRNFRVTDAEIEFLDKWSKESGMTKTEIYLKAIEHLAVKELGITIPPGED